MKLIKVRRVLRFKQEAFIDPYIKLCTLLRQLGESDFSKLLWKLMINSVFGKFIEDIRQYLDSKIVINQQTAEKWINSPRFTSLKILDENLIIIFLKRHTVFLNKPISTGFTILELAKYFMYQQYYKVIKPTLGNCEVLMSDTDSFLLYVKNKQPTDNIKKLKSILDFSNYPKCHVRYNEKKKNKLGFFKDELKGDKIKQFCGLRSKTYAFLLKEKNISQVSLHSKCKGITKSYRKKLSFDKFTRCIKGFNKVNITQFQIRAKNHRVFTAKINKLCFSSFDDKRYLLDCGVHSLPYGSKLIAKIARGCPFCKNYKPQDCI
jgi:hypothetical protein